MTPFWESSDFTEALVVKGLLEQAGFAVHMDNFNMSAALPNIGFMTGYRLWVADEDASAAEALIKQAQADAEQKQDEEEDEPTLACPRCGSGDTFRYGAIPFFLLFLYGAPGLIPKGNFCRCRSCGKRFRSRLKGTAPEADPDIEA